MTYQLFNMIASAFLKTFGGSLFLPFFIIAIIALTVLAVKGGKVVFFVIMVPLVSTIFTFGASRFFQGLDVSTTWVPVTGWLILGLITAAGFWKIMQ